MTAVAGDMDQLVVKLDEQADPTRLTVSGDIDLDTCWQFELVLSDAARSGPLVVDLTDVRLLGGVGIHILITHQADLHTVEVRAGTVVARSLALVGYSKLTVVSDR